MWTKHKFATTSLIKKKVLGVESHWLPCIKNVPCAAVSKKKCHADSFLKHETALYLISLENVLPIGNYEGKIQIIVDVLEKVAIVNCASYRQLQGQYSPDL